MHKAGHWTFISSTGPLTQEYVRTYTQTQTVQTVAEFELKEGTRRGVSNGGEKDWVSHLALFAADYTARKHTHIHTHTLKYKAPYLR